MPPKRNSKGHILKGEAPDCVKDNFARGRGAKRVAAKTLALPDTEELELDKEEEQSGFTYLMERTDKGKLLIDLALSYLFDELEEAHLQAKLSDAGKQKILEKLLDKSIIPPRPVEEDPQKDELNTAIEEVHKRIKARSSKPAGPGRGHKKNNDFEDGEDEASEEITEEC
jgi:hypothetical protein